MNIPISPPSCVSFPLGSGKVVTKHQADIPVLCSCFPLAIYFTFGSVYMPLSYFVTTSLPPPHILKWIL